MELSKEDINNLLFYYGKLSYVYYNTTDYLTKLEYIKEMNKINKLLGTPMIRRTFNDYLYLLKEIKNEDTNI